MWRCCKLHEGKYVCRCNMCMCVHVPLRACLLVKGPVNPFPANEFVLLMQFLHIHTNTHIHTYTHTHTHTLAKCFTQGLGQAEMFIFLQLCFSRVCLKSQLWAGHCTPPGRQIENTLLRTWSDATRAEKGLIRHFWLGGEINYLGACWGIDSYSCCVVVVVAMSVCPPCTLQCPTVQAFSFTFRVCRTSSFFLLFFLQTFFLIRGICWIQQEQHSCSHSFQGAFEHI